MSGARLEAFWAELRAALSEARRGVPWPEASDRIGQVARARLGDGEQLVLAIGLARSLSPDGKRALAASALEDAEQLEHRAAA